MKSKPPSRRSVLNSASVTVATLPRPPVIHKLYSRFLIRSSVSSFHSAISEDRVAARGSASYQAPHGRGRYRPKPARLAERRQAARANEPGGTLDGHGIAHWLDLERAD